jgi:hypothetical protein
VTTTNAAIVTEALQRLGVVADGRGATPTQMATGMVIFNDNMLTQQRDGWRLGWFPQTGVNASANVAPLRDEDVGDVKLCLCAWLAPAYGVTIPPAADPNDDSALSNQIKNAFRRLTKRSMPWSESDLSELSRPQGAPYGGGYWL